MAEALNLFGVAHTIISGLRDLKSHETTVFDGSPKSSMRKEMKAPPYDVYLAGEFLQVVKNSNGAPYIVEEVARVTGGHVTGKSQNMFGIFTVNYHGDRSPEIMKERYNVARGYIQNQIARENE